MANAAGITFREAQEDDAQAMLDYLRELTTEPALAHEASAER